MTYPRSLFLALIAAMLLLPRPATQAESATWNVNPIGGDWNTAENWTPVTIPNGSADIASFAQSAVTAVAISERTEVNSIVFEKGASPFTISTGELRLTISGAGVVNSSGVEQNFLVAAGPGRIDFTNSATADYATFTQTGVGGSSSIVYFHDTASAGEATFINEGGFLSGGVLFYGSSTAANGTFYNLAGTSNGGATNFWENSNAGNATFTCEGGSAGTPIQGFMNFFDGSSAANATISLTGAYINGASHGVVAFYDTSTAANARLIVNGGSAPSARGARVYFAVVNGNARAANSTLIANGGTNGGQPGVIIFQADSRGDKARIELFGGKLDLTDHNPPGLGIGSIEGDGVVRLGVNNLTVGANNLSTTFSGSVKGDEHSSRGSLTKRGTGTLTLSGSSSYSGPTIVSGGTLLVSNSSGSGTGTGAVSVDAGSLGGSGIIVGAVTVGTGEDALANLAPAGGSNNQAILTVQSAVTFRTDSVYICTFQGKGTAARTDELVANGVSIESGAIINLSGNTLAEGLILTVISNTSGNPISGTFSNLPDGAIVNVNGNNLQASYTGGDGNDLTLTVVP